MIVLLLKVTVILLIGALVTACMSRASAASRHIVLTASLVGALLMPVARVVMPALELRVLPTITIPVANDDSAWLSQTSAASDLGGRAAGFARRATSTAPYAGDPGVAIPWLSLLGASGIIVLLLRSLANRRARRRIWADAVACPDSRLVWAADRVRGLLGLTRPVSTRLAAPSTMPATFGSVSPKLLLPRDAADWGDERLDAVLTHELTHVRRFDDLAHAVARAAAALYWYHPLASWMARQAQLERERACDDAVLRLGMRPSAYAEHLLTLREALPLGVGVALPMARRAQMAERLRAILDPTQRRTPRSRVSAAIAVIVIATSAVVGAALFTAPITYGSIEQIAGTAPTPQKITITATRASQPPQNVPPPLGVTPDSTPDVAPKGAEQPARDLTTPPSQLPQSGSDFSGTWEPVSNEVDRLVSLWNVGLAYVKGRFAIVQTSDSITVRQTLPADELRVRLAISAYAPSEMVFDLSTWKNTNRLDGDVLVWQFAQPQIHPVHFRRVQTGTGATQVAPQPIPAGTFGEGAYRPGNGVTNPIRIREVKPVYTDAALKAGLQGSVELEAVIAVDGTVADVRVVRSLDDKLGLDENAKDVVRRTPFVPCKIGDKPVACLVVFELQFTPGPPTPIAAGQFGAGAYRPGNGVTNPLRNGAVTPRYTKAAMDQKIEGTVELEAVVGSDGAVTDVRIVRSLDKTFGLDESAMDSVRRTAFTPCKLADKPVACVVVFELQFTLR